MNATTTLLAALVLVMSWGHGARAHAPAVRTAAVLTFEHGRSRAERCRAHALADLLSEQLRAALPAEWAVLNRSQVLRRPRGAARKEAQLRAAAESMSAAVVVAGEIDADRVELWLYDVGEERRVDLGGATIGADVGTTARSLAADVLAKLAPEREPVESTGLPSYPVGEACEVFAAARAQRREGDGRAALTRVVKLADRAVIASGDNPRALALAAEARARRARWRPEDLEDASALARKALAGAPELPEAHWALALTLERSGAGDEAIAAYQHGAELDRGFGELRANLGALLLQRGRLGQALQWLREALELDRASTAARMELAAAYVSAGDGAAALDVLAPVLPNGPDDERVRLLRGEALNRAGLPARAVDMLAPLVAGSGAVAAEARFETALARLARGELEAADEGFRAVAGLERWPALAMRGAVGAALTAVARQETDAAGLALAELVAKDAEQRWALPVRAQAVVQALAGRVAGAIEGLRDLVAREPEDHEGWYDLGVLLHRSGELDQAKAAYGTAVALNPRAAWAWHNLGLVELARGEVPAAIQALEQAVAVAPRSGAAANALGVALWRAGRTTDALQVWRRFATRAREATPPWPLPAELRSNLAAAEAAR